MKTGPRLALLTGTLALSAATAVAQPHMGLRIVPTNRTSFSLPVKMDERDRAELKELKLYVKAVLNGLPGDWVCRETAPPTQTKFAFRAPQDGEYWFSFVTVDHAGHVTPADVDKEPPGLIVIVDTRAPELDVRAMTAVSGQALVRCDCRDDYPDPASVQAEYLANDRSWRPLDPLPGTPGVFRVPPPDQFGGVVRATASDKAGNKATREVELGKTAEAGPAVARAAPEAGPMSAPLPPGPSMAQSPAGALLTGAAGPPAAPPASAIRRAERPPTPEPKPAVAEAAAPAARAVVNSRHCALDYAVDTPHVVRVEAYATRDGNDWVRVGEDTDRSSPIEFTLPEDGAYGVKLVVSTAAAPGAPPAAGDDSDAWIEVDSVRPDVLVHGARAGTGPEARVLTIAWSAQDRNLAADAVEVHAAGRPGGPWQPLVRGLRDKGTVQCAAPPDLGDRLYLRVQASDRAGNVGRWESREPILLDGARPKARVLGVTAGR
jgi:hypothetical protein